MERGGSRRVTIEAAGDIAKGDGETEFVGAKACYIAIDIVLSVTYLQRV